MDEPFGMGQACEVIRVPHVYPLMTIYKPMNDVDRVTHPVDIIWALSPSIPGLPE